MNNILHLLEEKNQFSNSGYFLFKYAFL